MASVIHVRDVFRLVRKGIDVRTVQAHVQRPFRFLLAGDPALVGRLRILLLSGHEGGVPLDAAACLETYIPAAQQTAPGDVRALIFTGRPGDANESTLLALRRFNVPVFLLTVDENAGVASGPSSLPAPGTAGEYVVPGVTREYLRQFFFGHLVDSARGVEIAVGRRLPPLRETVASKLTRDAAKNALKVSLASAVVDHIPLLGAVAGVFASAGDMVAITGIQMMLLLNIEAAYGNDPDIQRMWQLLPVVGGGLGWRTLARELSGFIPVAGIAIKGAIAYAGTIVVGESVTFLLEHGKHMSREQATNIFERTKKDALAIARDLTSKLRRKPPES
ncbi:MAG TPA: hypothetical protein VGF18_02305 [Candidatus Tumulicola sp.]|jgi:uncharacterized protein (DUF697 family)